MVGWSDLDELERAEFLECVEVVVLGDDREPIGERQPSWPGSPRSAVLPSAIQSMSAARGMQSSPATYIRGDATTREPGCVPNYLAVANAVGVAVSPGSTLG